MRRVIVGTEGSCGKWFYLRVVFYDAAKLNYIEL